MRRIIGIIAIGLFVACGSGGNDSNGPQETSTGGAVTYSPGTVPATGGTTATTATPATTQKSCKLFSEMCDPKRGCYAPGTQGQECHHVTVMQDSPSGNGVWKDYYMCIPSECESCDKSCAFIDPYSSELNPDPSYHCKFDFCDPTDDWVNSPGAPGGSGTTNTGTGGKTTVTPPKVNCDSYSFRGCSDVGSSTFSSNCVRAGCNFKKTNCKTSGTVGATTSCDCVCY